MSILGAMIVSTFGDETHLKKAQAQYATDILTAGQKGEKAKPEYWLNKYSASQLNALVKAKKKNH